MTSYTITYNNTNFHIIGELSVDIIKHQSYNGCLDRYYINGKRHNSNGPAVICSNGTKYYCINGKLHNSNGPAAIYSDGTKFYYINGKRHNINGPALIYPHNGRKEYYINGKLHNSNGPAVIYSDGTKYYFINGKRFQPTTIATKQELRNYLIDI